MTIRGNPVSHCLCARCTVPPKICKEVIEGNKEPGRRLVRDSPPDQHPLRPQTQSLDNIHPRPNPRIEQNRDLVSHRVRNLGEYFNTTDRTIQLPSAMVADHHPLTPHLNRLLRILHMLDALQHDGPIPFRLDELEILPSVRGAGEDIGFPFAGGEESV